MAELHVLRRHKECANPHPDMPLAKHPTHNTTIAFCADSFPRASSSMTNHCAQWPCCGHHLCGRARASVGVCVSCESFEKEKQR